MPTARTFITASLFLSLCFSVIVANAAQLKLIAYGTITLADDEAGFGIVDDIVIGDKFMVEITHTDDVAGIQSTNWKAGYEAAIEYIRFTVGRSVFEMSIPAQGYDRAITVVNDEPNPFGFTDALRVSLVQQGGIIGSPFQLGLNFSTTRDTRPTALSDLTLPTGALPYALFDSGNFNWTEIEDGVMPSPLTPGPRVERFGGAVEFVQYINDEVAGAVIGVGSATVVPLPAPLVLLVPCLAVLHRCRFKGHVCSGNGEINYT